MAQCLLLSTEFPRWLVNKLVFFFFLGGRGGWFPFSHQFHNLNPFLNL